MGTSELTPDEQAVLDFMYFHEKEKRRRPNALPIGPGGVTGRIVAVHLDWVLDKRPYPHCTYDEARAEAALKGLHAKGKIVHLGYHKNYANRKMYDWYCTPVEVKHRKGTRIGQGIFSVKFPIEDDRD